MKKFLFCAAMVAAMLFTACGTKSEKTEETAEPQANGVTEATSQVSDDEVTEANSSLQAIVDLINAKAAEEDDTEFTAYVRGNDIVMSGEFDESELPQGMTIKGMMDMLNAAGDEMTNLFVAEMTKSVDEDGQLFVNLLRANKANLIIHFIGNPSGQEGELVIRYDQLPE